MGIKGRLLNGWRLDHVEWRLNISDPGSRPVTVRYDSRKAAFLAARTFPDYPSPRVIRVSRRSVWTRPRPKPVRVTPAEWAAVDAAVESGR